MNSHIHTTHRLAEWNHYKSRVGQNKTMQDYQIKRTGLPPIKFSGEVIGSGSTEIEHGNRSNRWTEVEIYKTKGGKFVATVGHLTIWQGESDHYKAQSFEKASDAIEWLKGEGGTLGKASQSAVEKAVQNDPSFAEAWVETVE